MASGCCSANDVVIVAAKRTPIGSLNGSLSSQRASSLGTTVIKSLLETANQNPEEVSEVILGQALTAGLSLYIILHIKHAKHFPLCSHTVRLKEPALIPRG